MCFHITSHRKRGNSEQENSDTYRVLSDILVTFETSSTPHSKPVLLIGSGNRVLSLKRRASVISKVLY